MATRPVFLSASPDDSDFAQRLAQAISVTGTPVVTQLPAVALAPEPDETVPALVLVLSSAALASDAQAAAVRQYIALLQADPSIPAISVLLDPLPAEAVPPELGGDRTVTALYGTPGVDEALIGGVLQRLGLAHPPGTPAPVPQTVTTSASPPIASGPASNAPVSEPTRLDGVGTEELAAEEPTAEEPTAEEPTAEEPTAEEATAEELTPGNLRPNAPLELETTSVVPVPVMPVPVMLIPPRAHSWRQRVKRQRRPIAVGIAASLVLLLIACVVFSLGVGSPGQGADRLDSGVPGGAGGPQATATATVTAPPAPTASPTRAHATATTSHATPTIADVEQTSTPTVVPPTPTPTLAPGTGLHGDYYHDTKVSPGTPVPYPNFGSLWFSQTDPKISFGYGNQSRTYTPPLGSFDSPVCPSPPTSSPCSPFGVRWTGFVSPRYTETYTFTTDADDGVKLWINGQLLIDNWQIQPDTQRSGSISLTAGQLVAIQIEYYENGEGPATMVLQWQSASQAFEVIPPNQLYPPS